MESLLIIYKLIVWGYAAFDYLSSKQQTGAGFVLVSLIYFCLQLFALIVRHKKWKRGAAFGSVVLLVFAAVLVEPLWALLLPLNGYELTSLYIHRVWGIGGCC
ncbi:hypothetical protein LR69_01717 [Geobacillus sp. BCO2]|nr:hypothetical protein LR69_01717 [Geobacillus sp. BCO2]